MTGEDISVSVTNCACIWEVLGSNVLPEFSSSLSQEHAGIML